MSSHEFDGIVCETGNRKALERLAAEWKPGVIAAHGLGEDMWSVLEPVAADIPVRAWLHGSEIPQFMRRKALVLPQAEQAAALEQVRRRCEFWDCRLANIPPNMGFVFVSNASVDMAREDWGSRLDEIDYCVVPNPVDTQLFRYRAKTADDRFSILLIRPFDSRTYANDLAIAAIGHLAGRDGFDRLRFTIIGDGPLFDETLAPVRGIANVTVQRRFLRQEEIVEEHRRNGIFLVPTRLDTQGLSRDEAMASGLVPVTNAIPAVEEFVDESCAALAPPGDSRALAAELSAMIDDSDLFLDRSAKAAGRIERERSNAAIIPLELALLAQSANG